MDYEALARQIYVIVGPSSNITQSYNCMTRLRLHVKTAAFTKEELQRLPGVLGVILSGDEWQIVVGPGKAAKLAQAFQTLVAAQDASFPAPPASTAAMDRGEALHAAIRKKNATPGKLVLKKIARIFTPIIPALSPAA